MKSGTITAIVLLACAALLCAGCGKKDAGAVKWLTSMEDGKSTASAEEKHLVVYYSADWSKMSEQFEDDVLDNEEVRKKLVEFVAVHVDADVDEETPKSYGVNAFPTTIFYTPEGEEVTRVVGVVEAKKFLGLLDDVLAGRVETLKELLAREEANPEDLELAYEVGTMYVETGRADKARSRFEKIVAQDPENKTGHRPSALMQLGFIDLTAQQEIRQELIRQLDIEAAAGRQALSEQEDSAVALEALLGSVSALVVPVVMILLLILAVILAWMAIRRWRRPATQP